MIDCENCWRIALNLNLRHWRQGGPYHGIFLGEKCARIFLRELFLEISF